MWSSTAPSSRCEWESRSRCPHGDGRTSAAPSSGARFEDTGASRTAVAAVTVGRELPAGEVIPITLNQCRVTEMTIRALPLGVMDVAGVDVAEGPLLGDAPREVQGGRRGRGCVAHLPVGMKGAEV